MNHLTSAPCGHKPIDEKVLQAFSFASTAHSGQYRVSGEPYIHHPVAVAQILLDLGIDDPHIIASALLHDTMEDCGVKIWIITLEFGPEVADIVWTATKPEPIGPIPVHRADLEIQKHIARNAYDFRIITHPNWRVSALKLADILHNARTLAGCDRAKIQRFKEKYHLYYIDVLKGLERRAVKTPELRRIARYFRREIQRELEKYIHI